VANESSFCCVGGGSELHEMLIRSFALDTAHQIPRVMFGSGWGSSVRGVSVVAGCVLSRHVGLSL
jgi:hypothetical protein